MFIQASSALTSLGDNPEMIQCALSSNISAYQESPHLSLSGAPMRLATVDESALPPFPDALRESTDFKLPLQQRLFQLCLGALSDEFVKGMQDLAVPVLLAVPKMPVASLQVDVSLGFIKALGETVGLKLDLQASQARMCGRADALELLMAAQDLFRKGYDYVLLGAVDSYIDTALLGLFDKQERLLTSARMQGFVPGEGAAFILLAKQSNTANVCVLGMGVAQEPGGIYSDLPNLGDGLSKAIETAIVNNNSVDHLHHSMNGEAYWVKELGVAMIRNSEVLGENMTLHHIAEGTGDLGCAYGMVNLSLLCHVASGIHCIAAASDDNSRAAITVAVKK